MLSDKQSIKTIAEEMGCTLEEVEALQKPKAVPDRTSELLSLQPPFAPQPTPPTPPLSRTTPAASQPTRKLLLLPGSTHAFREKCAPHVVSLNYLLVAVN